MLNSSNTTTRFASTIVDCNNILDAIAGSPPERPEQVGLRPRMVFPSLLREDWDAKLSVAGMEHLARQTA